VTSNVIYQLAITGREWRRTDRPVHAFVLIASWAALGVFGSVDFLAWLGAGEIFAGLRGACLGIVCIATFQSAILSRDLLDALRQSDQLNAELAARVQALEDKNAEVSVLNAELRRQISARSEQMAMVLAHSRPSDGMKVTPLVPGSVVDGRYRIERAVGAGGMGAVYEVTRLADSRRFALKVLTDARDGSAIARFAREAQIVAEIAHPNVVAIVDVEITATGMAYLVMEFVKGLSLRQHTNRYGDVDWALPILGQIAEGLAVVHTHGVVHRDLKPANILVTMEAGATVVKIADFGISSAPLAGEPMEPATPTPNWGVKTSLRDDSTLLLDRAAASERPAASGSRSLPDVPGSDGVDAPIFATIPSSMTTARELSDDAGSGSSSSSRDRSAGSGRLASNLTRTGILMGTPKYMAPELAMGVKEARTSSDLFSFGVIAYELLTGKAPFTESPAEKRLRGSSFPPPPPLREQCARLPPRIADMLDRCLAKDPEMRPTARELADLLARPSAGRAAV
jgi:serine/threonine protein kinase